MVLSDLIVMKCDETQHHVNVSITDFFLTKTFTLDDHMTHHCISANCHCVYSVVRLNRSILHIASWVFYMFYCTSLQISPNCGHFLQISLTMLIIFKI